MIRKAFIVLLSLLALAWGGLWAVSYEGPQSPQWLLPKWCHLYYHDDQRCVYFTSLNGWVRIGDLRVERPYQVPGVEDTEGWAWLGSARWPKPDMHGAFSGLSVPHLFGVFYLCDSPFGSGRMRAVAVPHGLVMGLLLAYPTVAFVHGPMKRRIRKRRGLCVGCGYNLTRNVSGVCPECGRGVAGVKS